MIGLLAGTAFALLAARALQRRMPTPSPAADLVVFLLLFTAVQSLMVIAAGLAELLSCRPLAGASAAGLALLWLAGERPDFAALRPAAPATRMGWLFLIGTLAGGAALLVKVLVFTPYWGDAVYYHLPPVAEWVQKGRFVHGFTPDPRTWFPSGFQLVEAWWVVFTGRETLLEMGGVQMWALALAALSALARAHGLRPGLAVFSFAFLPAVILHATSCGNDLAVAALILAACSLVASRAPRPLQALPLLLAASVKATALFAMPGLFFYAIVMEKPEAMSRRWGAVALAIGVLLGGFWYARNAALKGHPLYPAYGEGAEMAVYRMDVVENFDNLQRTLKDMPRRMPDPDVYVTFGNFITGWGWFVLPAGLPLTILAFRSDPRFRLLSIAFLGGWIGVMALSPYDPYNLRMALWFPALFVLGAARAPARAVLAAAALAAALNAVGTVYPYEMRQGNRETFTAGLPPGAPVACIFAEDAPSYFLYGQDFSRRVAYPRSMEELAASGVRHVWTSGSPAWWKPGPEWVRINPLLFERR